MQGYLINTHAILNFNAEVQVVVINDGVGGGWWGEQGGKEKGIKFNFLYKNIRRA